MKYVIIPDIHGRKFWRSAIIPDVDKYIFLGDYIDPYPQEGISNEQALNTFLDIIEFKKSNLDKVILLLGNHDLGYLFNSDFCSSRHWYEKHEHLHELYNDNIKLFDIYYRLEDSTLLTHAGVLPGWLDRCGLSINDFYKFNDWLHDPDMLAAVEKYLFYIDFYRGGWDRYGSPVWGDLRRFMEDIYLLDISQIFGHTQLECGPFNVHNNICIDCRRAFLYENGLKELNGESIKYSYNT